MAPQQQVPGFGDWEAGNIQYSAVFEKARKERRPNSEREKRNPSDPQQEERSSKKNPHPFASPQRKHGPGLGPEPGPGSGSGSGYGSPLDSRAGERISSGQLPKHQTNQRQRGHNRASSNNGSSYSITSTPPHQESARVGSRGRPAESKAASVPQFGSWNQIDPSSAEGYTAIFSKVKEERHGNGSLPMTPPKTPISSYGEREEYNGNKKNKAATSTSKFKMCFCFGA